MPDIKITGDSNIIGDNNTVDFKKITTSTEGVTMENFIDLLKQVQELLGSTYLNEDDRRAAEASLNTIEKEAGKSSPRLPLIESSLKSIKSIAESTESIGTTAAKLLPLTTKAIELARQLFP